MYVLLTHCSAAATMTLVPTVPEVLAMLGSGCNLSPIGSRFSSICVKMHTVLLYSRVLPTGKRPSGLRQT